MKNKVSILVLMELPLQQNDLQEYINGLREVSILVLMELPLQRFFFRYRLIRYRCFNPCFNGTTSATKISGDTKICGNAVSILVLMELPLQPEAG